MQLELAAGMSAEQLRDSALVSVGLFDNPWTMDLAQSLRYVPWIQDTNIAKNWEMNDVAQPPEHDFGIVARMRERSSGQLFMVIGGISGLGTQVTGPSP